MPTLQVSRLRLFNILRTLPATSKVSENIKLPDGLLPISADEGKSTDKAFAKLCFRFGVELDEVTTLSKILEKEKGAKGKAEAGKDAEEILYKIDLPANRYDLMSLEGFATALQVFLNYIEIPKFTIVKPANPIVMTVKSSIKGVRPYVVCAVLRDVHWDVQGYNSFIDLQEKLHGNLCRKRTVASVGTHDLQTILKDAENTPHFTYEAVAPADFSFVPLSTDKEITGAKLIEELKEGSSLRHLSKFVGLIDNIPAVPLIRDHKGRVLSLPPIINSEFSKISVDTHDIFIECTATDEYKAEVVVNQLLTNFSRYCSKPFTVEPVTVVYEVDGADKIEKITPDVGLRQVVASVERMQRGIGVDITGAEMVELLKKMMIEASVNGDELIAEVPPNRSDILHACDIMEDVAIAYGYDAIPKEPVPTNSLGTQQSLNHLQHLVRLELAMAGYREVLPFSLCSEREGYQMLNRTTEDMEREAVRISNPQTQEFQICRTSLLPGLLKTLQQNIAQPIPIKMFEVQDVVLKDATNGCGARNERRVAALYCSDRGSLEVIHGVVDLVLMKLEATKRTEYRGVDHPTFFPGQHGEVLLDGKSVGGFGVLHPEVSHNHWGLPYPVAYMEFNLEPFDNLEADVNANKVKNVTAEHEPKETI